MKLDVNMDTEAFPCFLRTFDYRVYLQRGLPEIFIKEQWRRSAR